ncbi:hypothetical protein U0070_023608, partial [Myodes glareolus]
MTATSLLLREKWSTQPPTQFLLQRFSTKERYIQDQQSQKNVQFIKEAQTPHHPSLLPLNTTLNLVHFSQHGAIVPMESIIEKTENLFHVKNLGPILGKISKDSNRYLEKISSKVTRGKSFEVRNTHQALEEHIVQFQVKHRWGEPLKMLKPINKNLFKMKKGNHVPRKTMPGIFEGGGNLGFFSTTRKSSLSPLLPVRILRELQGYFHLMLTMSLHRPYQSNQRGSLLLKLSNRISRTHHLRNKRERDQRSTFTAHNDQCTNPEAYSHQAKTVSEFSQSVEKKSASQPQ